jgi:hypothetical protein
MNLLKVGDTILNMDRVNGIRDHQPPSDPAAPSDQAVLRVLLDGATIDLEGVEAQSLRRWVRHHARNLAPQRNEQGEDLLSPELQLMSVVEGLLALIDRDRPRDPTLRAAVRRLAEMIKAYITDQLPPATVERFEKKLAVFRADAQHFHV